MLTKHTRPYKALLSTKMTTTLELRHYQYLFYIPPFVCPLCTIIFPLQTYIPSHPQQAHWASLSPLSSPETCPDHYHLPVIKLSLLTTITCP